MRDAESKIEWWARWLIPALLIPLFGHLLWVYSAELAHREDSNSRVIQHAVSTQHRVSQVCLRRETRGLIAQCAAEETRAGDENKRREKEVRAQEETAAWTRYLAVMAFLGLGVSSIGIWAVWRTIKQGQEANQLARDLMEIENRPILEFVGIELQAWAPDILMAVGRWTNIGRMPAYVVSTVIRRAYIEREPSAEDIAELRAANGQAEGHAARLVAIQGKHDSPPVSVQSHMLGIEDRGEQMPENLDRWMVRNRLLLIATVKYRAAIGGSREWETDQELVVLPRYAVDGKLRIDEFWVGQHKRLRMS